jgi:ABC-type multidrug transport system fused ATPase/permease subunit
LIDVSFRYPGTHDFAVRDVTLEIQPSEIVAVVGDNGSGKTTLAKLLAGLYDPECGSVRWGDLELARLEEQARRGHVAFVFQDFLRLHYSVAENIGLGNWRLKNPHRTAWAGHAAGVAEFAAELPSGYETRLGREFEDGHELSTGQWQRIVLARTLFGDALFVVFDEPTAALDPHAEVAFFDQFRALVNGRAALVISHRMISARMADRVYVLEHGQVVEQGTHTQLVGAQGKYASMVKAQSMDNTRTWDA